MIPPSSPLYREGESVMTDKIELHGLLSLSHVSCVLYHVALDSCSHCVATLVLPLPVTLLYIRPSVLSVFRFANINSHNILLSISQHYMYVG